LGNKGTLRSQFDDHVAQKASWNPLSIFGTDIWIKIVPAEFGRENIAISVNNTSENAALFDDELNETKDSLDSNPTTSTFDQIAEKVYDDLIDPLFPK
jgi:hypothetical protein